VAGRGPYDQRIRDAEEGVPVAGQDAYITDLVDIASVALTDLRSLDHPILTQALQRAAEEARDSVGVVAGFQAAI
jgi:FXSXX-COOH protein